MVVKMKRLPKELAVRVRMVATPQVEYRYAYWDIYSEIYVLVDEYINKDDKRDMEKLFKESLKEFPGQPLDVNVFIGLKDFIDISDDLVIKLSEECARLKG